jgi:hypothetical protein
LNEREKEKKKQKAKETIKKIMEEYCFMCFSSRAGAVCPHGKKPLLLPKAEKAVDYEEVDGKQYCLTCVPDYGDKDMPCMHGMLTKYFLLPDSQEEEFGPEDACWGEDEDYQGEEIFEPEDM